MSDTAHHNMISHKTQLLKQIHAMDTGNSCLQTQQSVTVPYP
jgi:hypothetical protein